MNGLSKHGLVFWFLAPAFIASQLAILAVLVISSRKIIGLIAQKIRETRGDRAAGGPPTHPVSMTGRVETPSRAPEKPTSLR